MCYNTIRHACGSRIRRQSLSCSCGTNGGDRECSLRCGTCHQCGHAAGVAPMTRITTNNTAAAATGTSKPDSDDTAASDAAGSASTTATTSPTASSPTAAAAAGIPKLFPVSGVAVAAAAMASQGPAKVRSADARYSYP